MSEQIMFSLSEMMGIIGGVLGLCSIIIGFFLKRSVFSEIDILKKEKQDKPFCKQQKEFCGQGFDAICEDIKKIDENLKEGNKEFKLLNRKIDRIMGTMKVRFDDLNGD